MRITPRRFLAATLVPLTLVAVACSTAPATTSPSLTTTGSGIATDPLPTTDVSIAGAGHASTPANTDQAAGSTVGAVQPSTGGQVVANAAHPRLWITAADLPRLRGWASDANPVWAQGLAVELQRIRQVVDGGTGNDDGSVGWVEDPVESDAELLAFGSLVDPSAKNRAADAARAHKLLMKGITAAAAGPQEGAPYRAPNFTIDDRSRWWGEGWALTVDWIYPTLTAADKAAIRKVFLQWCAEEEQGGQTTNDHPDASAAPNDPALLADPLAVKWSENNYYTAHMRNITLMSLALDPGDDPNGQLHDQLTAATGRFLFVTDALLRGDGRGGAPAEGFEYGPQSLGYVAETLLALHTAGLDDPAKLGRQVTFAGNPFWDEVGPWLLNSLSPAPSTDANGTSSWLPSAYGDSQHYHNPDWLELFGSLGIYDASVGTNADRLAISRWIETQTPDGGAATLTDRVANADNPRESLQYFLLLDPAAAQPQDPRPALATSWLAPGVGRFSARTGWDPKASWFNFSIGWNQIDHQNADGLSISFFRNGEWLTKERSGYDVFTSDQKNTLAIQNDPPAHNDAGDYRQLIAATGSQFTYVPSGPGRLTATSAAKDYVFASADATDLYNSTYEGSSDVVQATRDAVWLEPDVVVVYDRATTKTTGRFKRFFLQLPSNPSINGRQATATTASGQQLAVTTLLPDHASLKGEQIKPSADGTVPNEGPGQIASGETMNYRLLIDAPGGPADVRFLNVLEGADKGASTHQATLVHTTSGSPFDGAVVGSTLVLFPVRSDAADDLQVQVPAGVTKIVVTGLRQATGYQLTTNSGVLHLQPGGTALSDSGGTIEVAA